MAILTTGQFQKLLGIIYGRKKIILGNMPGCNYSSRLQKDLLYSIHQNTKGKITVSVLFSPKEGIGDYNSESLLEIKNP